METPITLTRHRLTRGDYHRMGAAGILTEDDRVELIEGELVDRAPLGTRHMETVSRLTRLFISQTSDTIRVQGPIQLSEHSEPDIAIVRQRSYAAAHPTPEDLLLMVEVADPSGLRPQYQSPAYARHGIPEVWLTDLAHDRLEIYPGPGSDGYRQMIRPAPTAVVSPSQAPGVAVALSDIWC